MKIIALTDIHGEISLLKHIRKTIEQADLILLTGDITHFGRKNEIENILKPLETFGKKIMAVPGNCDYEEVGQYLQYKSISADRRYQVFKNICFAGLGGSLPCPGGTPNEYSENAFRTDMDKLYRKLPKQIPLVFMSHQPPAGSCTDRLSTGVHAGSVSVKQFIKKAEPVVCFCGHIHEGIGTDKIGATRIINPGPFRNRKYALAEIDEKAKVKLEICSF